MTVLAHQVRYDLLASARNPRARFFTFLFPILLLVIFASVFGNPIVTVDGVRVHASRFYVGGILTMSIVTAAYAGMVMSLVTLREGGVLKRRRAAPVPARTMVAGQALTALTIAGVMTVLLLVIGRVAYGVGLSPAALLATAVTVAVGTVALASLAFAAAGLIGSADAAQPIVQATMLPLYFISGVWIPTSELPQALRDIASVFPIEHLANALHTASVHSSLASAMSPRDLLVLAIWALGAARFATVRFRWLPSRA
jgi:ABC-2 type transport system permease protein